MRLIDADALIKRWDEMSVRGRTEFDQEIMVAPSIDIVRCSECKYWDDRRNDAWWSEEGACDLTSRLGHATYRSHDDFCSRGERKNDE